MCSRPFSSLVLAWHSDVMIGNSNRRTEAKDPSISCARPLLEPPGTWLPGCRCRVVGPAPSSLSPRWQSTRVSLLLQEPGRSPSPQGGSRGQGRVTVPLAPLPTNISLGRCDSET